MDFNLSGFKNFGSNTEISNNTEMVRPKLKFLMEMLNILMSSLISIFHVVLPLFVL